MMAAMRGGRLCGQVRYEIDAAPVFSGICHRRNRQKYSGSAFEPVMAFPSGAVSVQGVAKTYEDKGDSGKTVFRRFCPNCGPGLFAEAEIMPGITMILTGTMDDSSAFRPAMEICFDSAQDWTRSDGARQRFPKIPG